MAYRVRGDVAVSGVLDYMQLGEVVGAQRGYTEGHERVVVVNHHSDILGQRLSRPEAYC